MHLLASTWVVPARVAVCEWYWVAYRVPPIGMAVQAVIGLY